MFVDFCVVNDRTNFACWERRQRRRIDLSKTELVNKFRHVLSKTKEKFTFVFVTY